MSKREQEIIRHIEKEEILRKVLLGESRAPILSILDSDPQFVILFQHQLTMNHLKDLCKNCSKCCEISDVDLSYHDVERMSAKLKMSQSDFVSQYCIPHPKAPLFFYRLRHKPCAFLKDKRCIIYSARPNMCIFFPFLSAIQEQSWQIYEKQKRVSITAPLWCSSALETKKFFDNLRSMMKKVSPEDRKRIQEEARERLRQMN